MSSSERIDDLVEDLRMLAIVMKEPALSNILEVAANELERLQDAGDALATAYRTLGGLSVAYDTALRCWEDASRG